MRPNEDHVRPLIGYQPAGRDDTRAALIGIWALFGLEPPIELQPATEPDTHGRCDRCRDEDLPLWRVGARLEMCGPCRRERAYALHRISRRTAA